ncbi:MAG: hypothetical protein P4M11_06445 [Candidatus Pacebacteria bacterium]|nr:hypothetical protein [Candidatus Paceibacterota bacterium]
MYRAFVFLAFMAASSLLWFVSVPQLVDAQTTGAPPLSVDASPQHPAPYQTVTLTPSSTVIDIASSAIRVTINGKTYYQGSGGTPVTVPVAGPGSTTDVIVYATTGGQTYSQELQFHPASVALVVEPVSSTHPFYEGSGLVTSEGRVRIVAVPDIRSTPTHSLDPSTLTYTWSLGDQQLEPNSGIGKSVLDATAPQQYRDADVSVVVTSPDGSEVAQASATISPTDPITRLYVNDPLLGPLYDNVLSANTTMNGAEETYRGVPYYFSVSPTVSWQVNGNSSGTTGDITVRASGNGQGSAVLSFSATDPSTSVTANSTVSVGFGQQSSSGILGL